MRTFRPLLLLMMMTLAGPVGAGEFSAMVSAEAWPDDNVPVHGIVIVAWDGDPWLADGTPSVVLNTDTLRLGLHEMRLGDRWRAGVALAGEYGVAGLLPDYYVDGQSVPERGFLASYVEGEGRIKHLLSGGAWVELSVKARQWLLTASDDTADDLVLPDDPFVVMPRLHLGWWRLDDDAGWRHRHRVFPRLRGFAVGIDAGVDVRNDARGWGAVGAAFDAPDARNQPATVIPLVRQWMMIGVPVKGDRVRFEIEERAGFGVDEDDLTRARVGGMNPYVITVSGAPWAAWLTDRYVGGRIALPVRLFGDVEAAPTVGAVYLRDPDRAGAEEMGLVWGAGLAVDARFGRFQVDLRAGVSPPLTEKRDEGTAYSAYLGVGWGTGD